MNGAGFAANGTSPPDLAVASTSSYASSVPSAYEPPSPETPRPQNLEPAPAGRTRKLSTTNDTPTSAQSQARREPNARISFFDPANQAVLDRLLSGDILQNDWDEDAGEEIEVAEEAAQAMLTSVEEMLEGYEWASGDIISAAQRGTTDMVEARLLDELMALEKVCGSSLTGSFC